MIAPEIVELTREPAPPRTAHHHRNGRHGIRPVECDLMSISPKLANSTPEGEWAERHERLRISAEALRNLMKGFEYQLKFVIAQPTDLAEMKGLLQALPPTRPK